MKKLLNTLYVTTPDVYLALDGENVVVKKEDRVAMRIPIHNVEAIVAFNYVGASPALMRKCNENNVNLSFFHNDSFCARMIPWRFSGLPQTATGLSRRSGRERSSAEA